MPADISPSPRWWQWPTILSLDAPLVALAWQALLARVAQVKCGAPESFVLGSSVWLAYAADRWIEGWRLHPDRIRTQRHRFYQHARWPLALIWIAVLSASVGLAFTRLSREELQAGFLLLGPIGLYLLSHQLVHRHRRWRAPKEVCVAGLFGAGVALFLVAQPGAALAALVAPLILFTLLCFSNCALISIWEQEIDASHGQTSLALQFRRAAGISRSLPWMIAVAAAFAAVAHTGPGRSASLCAGASGILLGVIDLAETRWGSALARVLADAALLTPLVPLMLAAGR